MKSNNPITSRVQSKFKKLTTPTNQEVTLNADGTGGPIISPSGHIANAPKKCCEDSSPAKQTSTTTRKEIKAARKAYRAGDRTKEQKKAIIAEEKAMKKDGKAKKKSPAKMYKGKKKSC
jgi:hypothetical protein